MFATIVVIHDVRKQRRVRRTSGAQIAIEIAVIIDVGKVGTHHHEHPVQARFPGHVLELPVTQVVVEPRAVAGRRLSQQVLHVLVERRLKRCDEKILAVPNRNPRFDSIHTIDQVFPHTRREIEHFFSIYKELQGVRTEMKGWGGPRDARKAINDSRQAYLGRWIENTITQKAEAVEDVTPDLSESDE